MTVEEIKKRVRLAIDEVTPTNESEFISENDDQLNLNAVIQDKINYALLYVLKNIPKEQIGSEASLLSLTKGTNYTIDATTLVCTIDLPKEVLRVLSARMNSWKYSPNPIEEGTTEYLMQSDEYTRGTINRPVVCVCRKGGKLKLEMYVASSTEDTTDVSVVNEPNYSSTELSTDTTEIAVPEKYEAAFIYQVAALSMVAQRENIAENLFAISNKYLGVTEVSK